MKMRPFRLQHRGAFIDLKADDFPIIFRRRNHDLFAAKRPWAAHFGNV